MAVTATATVKSSATTIPEGYSIPSLPVIVAVEDGVYTTDISISNADASNAVTGITNVVGAVETDFEVTQAVTLKLDVAQTISANLTITSLTRVNEESSIFITGTEVYRCVVSFEYQ